MPASRAVLGAAVTSLDLAGSPVTVVEVWNAAGITGLAALAGTDTVLPAVDCCRQALGRSATENLFPGSSSEADWLAPNAGRSAQGAVEVARADLAARAAGVPLWLWLGGKARPAVGGRGGPDGIAPSRIADEPRAGWGSLKSRVLDRAADVIRIAPVAVGGPASVARLDAIARAFQLELLLVAETPLVLSRALAVHLTATAQSATLPPGLTDPAPVDVPWLATNDDYHGRDGLLPLPRGMGLGVELDRDRLTKAGGRRIVVQ